jgi:hypothetical protein
MAKRSIVVAVGMAVLLSLWAGAASAQAEVACGQPVTEDAVLDRDLTCTRDGVALTTADVTLDLGGHTIAGAGGGTGIVVRPCGQAGALSVRNGTVRGFGVGVHIAVESGCEHTVETTVEGLSITASGTGVLGGTGFEQVGPVVVRGNRIHRNTGNGITTAFIRPFHAIGNEITRNAGDGVAAFDDSIDRFEGNMVTRNGGRGAAFLDSVAAIIGNRFSDNAETGLIVRERFCGFKPLYDISVNSAMRNEGGGMSAAFTGCVDPTVPPPGTGNVAKHNAGFQCELIVCTRVSGP